MKVPNRPSFIDNAMEIVKIVSERSEDKFKKVGAIALDDEGTFKSTGYNGLPPNFDLTEEEWNDRDFRRPFMIHAEMNALLRTPRHSAHTLCCTMIPCVPCLVTCASHGIKKIFYGEYYSSEGYGSVENTHNIANRLGIELVKYEKESKKELF